MPGPATLAALDIGTNSFHLVVARLLENGFEVVTREKETVRLGHGGGDMKQLSTDAMDRGISSLRRMQRIAAAHNATIRAVATSAVREARNADEFLARAHREAKIDIEVISGLEESRLIHLGVLQAVPAFDRRLILVDIGGGSTEVLIGERGETLTARSFKLGAVRLTDRFFPNGTTSTASVKDCRSYVRSILATFEREVEELGFEIAIASSGTAETIARMIHAGRDDTPLHTFNRFEFTVSELQSISETLARKKSSDERRGTPGLDPGRADIIVAGALVLEGVADIYGIKSFVFSEAALREGVLLDTIARLQGGALHHLRDVSRRSIRGLAERCDDDPSHSAHVATLALQLFDATVDLHRLPPDAREYLEAGALLANVGLVISHSKHHLHSYYVIRNSELTGLTDTEIEIIAQIARYHRKSAPKSSHEEFGRLSADDQRLVKTLAAILRVAIGLDRSHDGRVRSVMANVRRGRVVIEAESKRGKEISLELYTANERADLLEEVLGQRVAIVAAPLPAA
ncbi:MAG TPA: Ppx/GppA phosphatase family protein [Ilumatobacteraceae bacterium]|nr:Ppx/GppA phosphatase family protein [Ilumatobacteraceae bacterium]